ncbi:MAG: leucine--tRNA ligase [Sphingobacteriales bacterium]|nr:MAG: leucine--tRNA ligase [Sphingobacteriales bacterium]
MEYAFRDLEQKWQQYWADHQTYKVTEDPERPKYYVLDMFPYPSGAGLHVGHPLGYIASDVHARYKRLRGFNVLHPMGYDAFGLPAEQYAIETGQHPAKTTAENIARYRKQLDAIGFSYDWSREVRTSDPAYYKWTQWLFLQLFHSWYDRVLQQARPIADLLKIFEKEGNINHTCPGEPKLQFDGSGWNKKSGEERRAVLMNYRLAYLALTDVWWCEALGTVLANDEVINGVSERGGFPCVRKKMRQWNLRITEYSDRLLNDLETIDWSPAVKEMQRNWIGKSRGAVVEFAVNDGEGRTIKVFTTRPDTLFGVDFLVLAPEHELVGVITTNDYRTAVAEYVQQAAARSERERMSDTKKVTGAFTGAYVTHPFTRKSVPVYIADYVLSGYGTGAIMGVPSGDDRDFAFAQEMNLPITNIFGAQYTGLEACTSKEAVIESSGFLSGLPADKAFDAAIRALEDGRVGQAHVSCRLRDAGFSRQRYWGEPFPIVYRGMTPYAIDEEDVSLPEEMRQLPVILPDVESYGPGPEGQGPLANIEAWMTTPAGLRETNTMPGYAGSSWYFLRYADPNNADEFASADAVGYWGQVDVYMGGTEHAVGHLLYSRFFTKVLFDLGAIGFDEPFKRLINQGMIQGMSRAILLNRETKTFYSLGHPEAKKLPLDPVRVNIALVSGTELDIEAFRKWRPEYADYHFKNDPDGAFYCEAVVEKMSKSKYNVVNPDDVVAQYGADTFRMYEMFLGPLEASKPWDTQGIEGVHRFLKKVWRLFYNADGSWRVTTESPTEAQLRTLHKTIKKVGSDIEAFSMNTGVSALMICVNELTASNCQSQEVLEHLLVILAPFAPHLAEELWSQMGHTFLVVDAGWPVYDEQYLKETEKAYPVAVNGKTRAELLLPVDATETMVQDAVFGNETVLKWLEGRQPKKIIFVPGKMINVVV